MPRTALLALVAVAALGSTLLAQSPGAVDRSVPSTDDLSATGESDDKQAAWLGILPGRTRVEEARQKLGPPLQEDRGADGLVLIYAPNPARGDAEVDVAFGRAARVVIREDGVVDHVHVGGFFKATRPRFEDLQPTLRGKMERASETSALSATAGVYDFPEAGVWLIVSTLASPDGRHEVLALRHYDPSRHPVLPVPKKPLLK